MKISDLQEATKLRDKLITLKRELSLVVNGQLWLSISGHDANGASSGLPNGEMRELRKLFLNCSGAIAQKEQLMLRALLQTILSAEIAAVEQSLADLGVDAS